MRKALPLVLVSTAMLVTACPDKQVKSFSPAHDQEAVAASAQLFWHSLRWSDFEGAAAVIEDANPRLDFLTTWSAKPPAQVSDFQIVHIELTEPTPEAERLEALVVVKVEGISTGSYTLSTEMLRQTWYRSEDNWYLDTDSLPFED